VNGGTAFKVEDCLKNAVDEVFTGTDFAKNWDNALAEPFGKKLKEAKAALDAAKRLAADAAEAEKIAGRGRHPRRGRSSRRRNTMRVRTRSRGR
jgi:hypothetical protein